MNTTKRERMELRRQARSRSGRADAARQTRVILSPPQPGAWAAVCHAVGWSRGFIATWSPTGLPQIEQRGGLAAIAGKLLVAPAWLASTPVRRPTGGPRVCGPSPCFSQTHGQGIHVIADNLSAYKIDEDVSVDERLSGEWIWGCSNFEMSSCRRCSAEPNTNAETKCRCSIHSSKTNTVSKNYAPVRK